MSDCFLGEIRMFAGNYNPENWILCNGQQMSVQQYQALYSLIGVTYGGDGVNNFNVPDLRGRVPVGQGTGSTSNPPLSPRVIGQAGGEEAHTVTAAEMAAHSHPFYTSATNATAQAAGPTVVYGQVEPTTTNYGLYTAAVPPAASVVQFDAKFISNTGGGQAHNNVMTTTAISFIMAVQGMYPTRQN